MGGVHGVAARLSYQAVKGSQTLSVLDHSGYLRGKDGSFSLISTDIRNPTLRTAAAHSNTMSDRGKAPGPTEESSGHFGTSDQSRMSEGNLTQDQLNGIIASMLPGNQEMVNIFREDSSELPNLNPSGEFPDTDMADLCTADGEPLRARTIENGLETFKGARNILETMSDPELKWKVSMGSALWDSVKELTGTFQAEGPDKADTDAFHQLRDELVVHWLTWKDHREVASRLHSRPSEEKRSRWRSGAKLPERTKTDRSDSMGSDITSASASGSAIQTLAAASIPTGSLLSLMCDIPKDTEGGTAESPASPLGSGSPTSSRRGSHFNLFRRPSAGDFHIRSFVRRPSTPGVPDSSKSKISKDEQDAWDTVSATVAEMITALDTMTELYKKVKGEAPEQDIS